MLILTRTIGQKIKIGDDVTVNVLEIQANQVRIGIAAPREVAVHREEIYARYFDEAREWADSERWKTMGELTYYWHMDDHREQIETDLADHLYNDSISARKLGPTDMSDMYNRVHQQTIMQDPFHGLLRICIRK